MSVSYSCGQGTFMNAGSLYHFQIAVGEMSERMDLTVFYHRVLDKDVCNTNHLMESYLAPEEKPMYFEGIQTFYVTLLPQYKEKLCAYMNNLLEDYAHEHPEDVPTVNILHFGEKQAVPEQDRQAQLYTMDARGVIEKETRGGKSFDSMPRVLADEFIFVLERCVGLEIINPLSLLDMLDRSHVPYTFATDVDDIITFRPHGNVCDTSHVDE